MQAWEWRANALADALAKCGALECMIAKETCELMQSAGAALQHGAALLGAATHAANNWRIGTTLADGSTEVTILRDTTEKPAWAGSSTDATAPPSRPLILHRSGNRNHLRRHGQPAPTAASPSQLTALQPLAASL